MGLDPSAVSAMLSPLVGSLTLFLGRGLTHTVRDLAWVHAHRRLHDLCTYHDPELVQHLTRYLVMQFSRRLHGGWGRCADCSVRCGANGGVVIAR